MPQIHFVTSNQHKVQALEAFLGQPVQQIKLDLPEIQATDVCQVVEQKINVAYELAQKPVLVEDTSLAFNAWRGLPGALIRWFLESVGNQGICQMLEGYNDLSAIAVSCWAYHDGETVHTFTGEVHGQISRAPRGMNGFGWDPIFIPTGYQKTYAEMSTAESEATSMRTIALNKFQHFLEEYTQI